MRHETSCIISIPKQQVITLTLVDYLGYLKFSREFDRDSEAL